MRCTNCGGPVYGDNFICDKCRYNEDDLADLDIDYHKSGGWGDSDQKKVYPNTPEFNKIIDQLIEDLK